MVVGGLAEAADRLLAGRHDPGSLRSALVDLYELWLSRAAAAAGVNPDRAGVALVAVGGLGRRDLVPFSDLDLVLVHDSDPGDPDIADVADALWYPLWDQRIGLDHSVRTPAEAVRVAAEDLRTATGLLDARHLRGDADLTARMGTSVREQWRRTARTRLPELADSARRRWRLSGEIAHSAEPDLKHGRGGLRDFGLLTALAAAQLAERPGAELLAARELLLDVRTELRRLLRRDRDVLGAADAAAVACALDLEDRFVLARKLSGAARAVAYAVDGALRATAGTPHTPLGRRPLREPLDDGVVLHGGEVALARDALPARDPGLLLRVAAASARVARPIAQGTLRTLADSAPEPRVPWPAHSRQALTGLLGAGPGLLDAVEQLDRTGLWARLVPEWGAVRDLPAREPVHAWTVDRHLLQTCVEAASLTSTVSRPDLLLLGALLHDIGKGRARDHSELGAELTTRVAARLGFSAEDTGRVTALVRHHLLLAHTATRRDLSEPATLERVVRTLDGDPVLLDLLHALTEADSLATAPGVWTEWKARLVAELVHRCRTLLRGEARPAQDPPGEREGELLAAALASRRGQVRVETDGRLATVTLAAPGDVELLAPAAGVLALHSLEVHAATLRARDGGRVGVFTASPKFGAPPDSTLLREQFARAVAGTLSLTRRLAEKERQYAETVPRPAAAQVLWFDDETSRSDTVVLELRAPDRIGLLHRVATALRQRGAEVRWARVATLGSTVVDSFAVSRRWGPRDAVWRAEVELAVVAAASRPSSPT